MNQQECIPVGCVLPACCPYLPACTPRGVSAPVRAVCSQGCLPLVPGEGGAVSQHAPGQTPPPVNRMTDRHKNITFSNFAGGSK